MPEKFLIGTQRWQFRAWEGGFYAPGIPESEMLESYSRMFPTVEVDATFFGVPAAPVVKDWRSRVPQGFKFSLKLPQEVTHSKRLAGDMDVIDRFLDRAHLLEDALGPILVQLPSNFLPSKAERQKFMNFVPKLSKDVRWVFEFKHPAWLNEEVLAQLSEHKVAVALVDGRWIPREKMIEIAKQPTTDFVYVRWMGSGPRLFDHSKPSREQKTEVKAWGQTLKKKSLRVDTVYGYFHNEFEGHAPHSARAMQKLLGVNPVDPSNIAAGAAAS